ncbi:3-hydroxyacyl-CoA dehydrogenase [Arthrobacter sp. B2a2-09]|uniref:3-hydroxyacyl-CoA dehydrogenase n=1 Tax=Arthrobacter sp. B2a2-09 TaxID=2952822 RepID=UPI0022CD9450|nr:3-hydroxyacyl-CoA dehydrogenase [Arthrobacter sp. B2a2-09]MCZ9881619.1 3-hydroxyacyl-CoA dehydrogenase [Arthrobacter sp. B2a2-09]
MDRTVTVVGAGSIGVAFSVLFAKAGFNVRLWDAFPDALPRARRELTERLNVLEDNGLLDEQIATITERVSCHTILLEALRGAELAQECAPERLEVKKELFQQLGAYSDPGTVLASSSSAIVSSRFARSTPASDRVLIAHPGNPPYLLPVIELVPSEFTSEATLEQAHRIYSEVGLKPVTVQKEVEGFIFNRLQGALLREAYCLLRDGVGSVEAIDGVVRDGLGRRWAFMGPFETVDLNTRGGIASHAEKMGPAYARMGAERGQHDPWTADLVASADAQLRGRLPLDEWAERVQWRDEQLMRLSQLLDRTDERTASPMVPPAATSRNLAGGTASR